MRSDDYVREKLLVAVEGLAVGTSPLQQRLEGAWISALSRLAPDDFATADGRALFEDIERALTAVEGTGDEGSVHATTAVMSDDEATTTAEKVVSLYGQCVGDP